MAQKTLERLLDTILEKATSEGVKKELHERPYMAEGHTGMRDPLFQDKAGYGLQLGEYRAFVLETSVRMRYPGDSKKDKPLLPDDNGKRMHLTLKKGKKKVLEARRFIFERKELNDIFKHYWEIDYNKSAETLLESIC